MSNERKAVLSLVLVTMLWGLTFPLVGIAVKAVSAYTFVFFRFMFAAVVFFFIIIKELRHTSWSVVGGALLLSVFNFISYVSQGIGLQTISPGESAFITSTAVIFVPLFSLLLRVNTPRLMDFLCSFLCLVGLYILTGANLAHVSYGELATLVCAIAYALYVIYVQVVTHRVPNYLLLAFYQILFIALFAAPFANFRDWPQIFSSHVISAFAYCALFATLLVMYLQMKYQKYVPTVKVALIFCLEPVFACVFSWLINGEKLTAPLFIGGGLILISISLPDVIRYFVRGRANAKM